MYDSVHDDNACLFITMSLRSRGASPRPGCSSLPARNAGGQVRAGPLAAPARRDLDLGLAQESGEPGPDATDGGGLALRQLGVLAGAASADTRRGERLARLGLGLVDATLDRNHAPLELVETPVVLLEHRGGGGTFGRQLLVGHPRGRGNGGRTVFHGGFTRQTEGGVARLGAVVTTEVADQQPGTQPDQQSDPDHAAGNHRRAREALRRLELVAALLPVEDGVLEVRGGAIVDRRRVDRGALGVVALTVVVSLALGGLGIDHGGRTIVHHRPRDLVGRVGAGRPVQGGLATLDDLRLAGVRRRRSEQGHQLQGGVSLLPLQPVGLVQDERGVVLGLAVGGVRVEVVPLDPRLDLVLADAGRVAPHPAAELLGRQVLDTGDRHLDGDDELLNSLHVIPPLELWREAIVVVASRPDMRTTHVINGQCAYPA